jgi:hypothetical protein
MAKTLTTSTTTAMGSEGGDLMRRRRTSIAARTTFFAGARAFTIRFSKSFRTARGGAGIGAGQGEGAFSRSIQTPITSVYETAAIGELVVILGAMRIGYRLRAMTSQRPTGECWCGCGRQTSPRAFFVQTHDRTAESAMIRAEYGSIPDFLAAHAYGPSGKNAKDAIPRGSHA